MLKNYFKIWLRNTLRQKWYTFINIAGLTVGMACFILILLWVSDELSYEKFHNKADQIYRVCSGLIQENGSKLEYAITPALWAPTLASEFPEVENFVRFYRYRSEILVKLEEKDKSFYEGNFYWADSTVLDIFTFPLIKGNPHTALAEPNSVILSESMAQKFFANENPIGQTITYINRETVFELQVKGVMKDVPRNSHFRPDFLASLSTFKPGTWHYTYNIPTSWTNLFYKSYILLKKGYDHRELEKKLPLFLQNHIGEQAKEFDPFLQPLKSIHLHSDLISEFEPNSDAKYVYIFLSVAFLILFVACINYMNLATARSACRAKEVGVRKTLGSSHAQLVFQFLGESVLTSFLAALVSVPVVEWMLPVFNVLAGKSLSIAYFENSINIFILFAFALFIGLISGSYPSLFLSRFMPVKGLKGRQNIGLIGHYPLRKLLVIFQFSITLFLLISTIVILKQLNLFNEGKIRFDRELVINIPLRGQGAAKSYESFKNEILRNSKIRSATASSHLPFTGNKIGTYRFPGILDSESAFESDYFVVDADFTNFFNLEIVSGRGFSKERDGLSESKSFILNERAVRELGVTNEQIIGKQIEDPFWKASGKVVGVVKDFHYKSMHSKVNPLVIKMDPWFVRFLSLKIHSDDFKNNLSFLKEKWDEFYPASPFSYTFLDNDLNKMYNAEEKMGLIFRYFSLIAILISCIGLYSLASFTTEQRTKEIGIRKVLGASVWDVVVLLCKDFIKLVFWAFLIAAPFSFFAMTDWLQSFAYRTNINVSVFMLSGFLMLLIVWLTVGYQSIKAAIVNPVKSLRYE